MFRHEFVLSKYNYVHTGMWLPVYGYVVTSDLPDTRQAITKKSALLFTISPLVLALPCEGYNKCLIWNYSRPQLQLQPTMLWTTT